MGLVGNKADLGMNGRRQVDAREVADYADENGLIFMETSAKRGENVNEIFLSVAKEVVIKQPITKPTDAFQATKLNKKENGGGCCGGSKTDKKS